MIFPLSILNKLRNRLRSALEDHTVAASDQENSANKAAEARKKEREANQELYNTLERVVGEINKGRERGRSK